MKVYRCLKRHGLNVLPDEFVEALYISLLNINWLLETGNDFVGPLQRKRAKEARKECITGG
jgi:hypothetical protein